jgi:hypothetical protein
MSDRLGVRGLREAACVEATEPGRFRATLSPYFSVVGRPNGGYLQCIIAQAASKEAEVARARHRDVTAMTTNFLTSPQGVDLDLVATVRRAGRAATFVHVAAFEGDRLTSETLITMAELAPPGPPRYQETSPSSLAPLEQCVSSVPVDEVNIRRAVDMRMDPSCVGWIAGEPGERAEILAWLKLDDESGETWDRHSILFASDCLPPATFPIGSVGWVPTLQLTTYVHADPAGEWLRARQWCVMVDGEMADERCELVDEAGHLVATSSQLMLCRFPSER